MDLLQSRLMLLFKIWSTNALDSFQPIREDLLINAGSHIICDTRETHTLWVAQRVFSGGSMKQDSEKKPEQFQFQFLLKML
jgi:hypothetical protein